MKYVVILGDGMADEPIAALGGKTPLDYAKTPCMDAMAGMAIDGKDKGEAENEAKPIDVKSLLP